MTTESGFLDQNEKTKEGEGCVGQQGLGFTEGLMPAHRTVAVVVVVRYLGREADERQPICRENR